MTRPLRIELAGALYHVTSRGDRREDIFLDETDRRLWLEILGAVCLRSNWRCHAWCQMNNHYHIVIETAEANLAQGMRQLNSVYTQAFNRRHHRVGHVFQGRYRAIMVEKETYLLEVARHVVLNPVRAGLVSEAADWPWSSYRATLAAVSPPEWLQTDWLLRRFGRARHRALAAYSEFVRAGLQRPSPWDALQGQIFLGSEAFVQQLHDLAAERAATAEIPRAQRRPLARPLSDYRERNADPKTAMAAAYATGQYTMLEIATYFGVHYATVSRAVKQAARAQKLDCKT